MRFFGTKVIFLVHLILKKVFFIKNQMYLFHFKFKKSTVFKKKFISEFISADHCWL